MTTKAKNSKDVKAAAANDVNLVSADDQKSKEQAITEAKKKVDDLQKSLTEARQELHKLTGKKEKADKGPGVIMSILSIVTESGKTGISKQEILDRLTKLFPDKSQDGMKNTISVQLPNRMAKERGVNIVKTEEGKYAVK